MAHVDGVIEAVRYGPDGKISLVRVYERRGPTWSDRVLLDREQFIARLRTKKKFMIGERVSLLASTFDLAETVRLAGKGEQESIQTGKPRHPELSTAFKDCLDGAPLF